MGTKRESEKPIMACSECGKTPAKYNKFIGAWLCSECKKKLNVEEMEKVEQNNGKLF